MGHHYSELLQFIISFLSTDKIAGVLQLFMSSNKLYFCQGLLLENERKKKGVELMFVCREILLTRKVILKEILNSTL